MIGVLLIIHPQFKKFISKSKMMYVLIHDTQDKPIFCILADFVNKDITYFLFIKDTFCIKTNLCAHTLAHTPLYT